MNTNNVSKIFLQAEDLTRYNIIAKREFQFRCMKIKSVLLVAKQILDRNIVHSCYIPMIFLPSALKLKSVI
jgi:hypothetical protein